MRYSLWFGRLRNLNNFSSSLSPNAAYCKSNREIHIYTQTLACRLFFLICQKSHRPGNLSTLISCELSTGGRLALRNTESQLIRRAAVRPTDEGRAGWARFGGCHGCQVASPKPIPSSRHPACNRFPSLLRRKAELRSTERGQNDLCHFRDVDSPSRCPCLIPGTLSAPTLPAGSPHTG